MIDDMIEVVANRNCVYQAAYHVIWCPEYRRDMLVGDVAVAVAGMLDTLCRERGWPVIAKDIQPDHIHLSLRIPPSIAVAGRSKNPERNDGALVVPAVCFSERETPGRTLVVAVVSCRHGRKRERRDCPALHRARRACHQEAISHDARAIDQAGRPA